MRRIQMWVWVCGILVSAGLGVAFAVSPPVLITVLAMDGATSVTVNIEWVFGAGFVITAGVLKYISDKVNDLEKTVTGPEGHGEQLAHGAEQLKLLKEVRDKVNNIAEHGCARQCPHANENPQTHPPSQF